VRNLERGNTKLSLKDVPSLCSGGADFRGGSVSQLKKGETTCSEDGRVLPTSELNCNKEERYQGAIVDVWIFII
jgi:hypothetical protein